MNSSKLPQKVSTFGCGYRPRDDGMISSKAAIRSRILTSSSHTRSNTLHFNTHRYSGSSITRSSNLFGSAHSRARSLLSSAHVLRSSGTQMGYTTESHQAPGLHTDYQIGVIRPSCLYPTTEPISSYGMQINGTTTSVIYPCPDQNLHSPELLIFRTDSAVSRDRSTGSPPVLRAYGPTIYTSSCSGSPPSSSSASSPSSVIPTSNSFPTCSTILSSPETGFGFALPLTELVDVSESGLFITLDSLDQQEREAYRTNSNLCPPCSFHSLIYMSIQSMKRHKFTLNDIISWIRDNFAYFRFLQSPWEVSLFTRIFSKSN